MTDGAKLAQPSRQEELFQNPAGHGSYQIIGWSKASEIIFTGKTLSAKESEDMGLVSKVVNSNEICEEASVLAGKIAKNAFGGPSVQG